MLFLGKAAMLVVIAGMRKTALQPEQLLGTSYSVAWPCWSHSPTILFGSLRLKIGEHFMIEVLAREERG